MQAIWGRVIVEENNLNKHISTLRHVLGEIPGENRFLVTVPGRGYRFVAAVREVPAEPTSAATDSLTAALQPRLALDGAADAENRGAPLQQSLQTVAVEHPPRRSPQRRWLALTATAVVAASGLAATRIYWLDSSPASTPTLARATLPNSIAILPFDNLIPIRKMRISPSAFTRRSSVNWRRSVTSA